MLSENKMAEKDNKMDKIKNSLIKLQAKIQDRVEDFQDQMQTKIEKSKLSKFVSHLSDDKSSFDDISVDKDADEKSSSGSNEVFQRNTRIPSLVVDEPNLNVDPKQMCKDFLTIERNGVHYRKCLSTSNLTLDTTDTNLYSSSDSCFSCCSSGDERYVFF